MSDDRDRAETVDTAERVERVETVQRIEFRLSYDEEIGFLVNEGVIRPGLLPSGFKDA